MPVFAPIETRHDFTPLGYAAALAANAGQNATGVQNTQLGLHAAQVYGGLQHQQDQTNFDYYNADQTDQRVRDLSDQATGRQLLVEMARAGNKEALASLQNEEHLQQLGIQQAGAMDRTNATNDVRMSEGQASRDLRSGIADQSNDTRLYGIGQADQRHYDDQDLQQRKLQNQQDYQQARMEAMQARSQQEADLARQKMQMAVEREKQRVAESQQRQQIGEMSRQRSILERRAQMGMDPNAGQRIGDLTGQIMGATGMGTPGQVGGVPLVQQSWQQAQAMGNPMVPDVSNLGPMMSDSGGGGGGDGGGVVQVRTVDEALSLPSGTVFVTPDGRLKVRP